MSGKKFHIGDSGPSICRVDLSNPNSRGCPFGGESGNENHFDSLAEVEEAFSSMMEKDGFSPTGQSFSKDFEDNFSQEMKEISAMIETKIQGVKVIRSLRADDAIEVGEKINSMVFKISRLEEKESYSEEELDRLSKNLSKTLKSLDKASDREKRESTFRGPLGKYLEESISVLPVSATNLSNRTINVEKIHGNTRNFSGQHVGQAFIKEVEIETESLDSLHMKPFSNLSKDDVYTTFRKDEVEEYSGLRVSEVLEDRSGKILRDGDSLEGLKLSNEVAVVLLEKEYVDYDLRIREGMAEKVIEAVPGIEKTFNRSFKKRDLYVGDKPRGEKRTIYRKIDRKIELNCPDGKITVNRPVYEIIEKNITSSESTITVPGGFKKISDMSDEAKSTYLHEYAHEVQMVGGAIGEGDIFNRFKKNEKMDYQELKVHRGFPDDYMGLDNGREVFTRATEGIFYPNTIQGDYMYSSRGENSREIREWCMGAWALSSAFAHSRKTRKA